MTNNQIIAIGREEIITLVEQHVPVTTWRTVRAWKKKYGLQIEYLPNGKPCLDEAKFLSWLDKKKLRR